MGDNFEDSYDIEGESLSPLDDENPLCYFRHLIDVNDLNSPDDQGNTALHTAVMHDSMAMLEHLVYQSHIDLNYKNTGGDTPLLMSLTLQRPDDLIMQLIKAGCDVNACNNIGVTPLQRAVSMPSIEVAQQLVKRGADIDAQDADGRTPLHFAIEDNNIEAVCMLLYYGADVTIACNRSFVPFTYALYARKLHIAEVLFDYYDEFSFTNIYGYTALHLAAWRRSPLALSILKTCVDVNRITAYGDSPLVFSMEYNSAELFKLIWSQLDCEILLSSRKPFLLSYVQTQRFATAEWLECLYLLLKSPVAFRLIEHCNNYMDFDVHECGFFWELLHTCHVLKVKRSDRMAIINICLSLGCEVHMHDINYAILLYGFSEELEAFMYATSCSVKFGDFPYIHFPLLSFILGTSEDPSIDTIIRVYKKHIDLLYNISEFKTEQMRLINSLRFFSIPFHKKQELLNSRQLSSEDCEDISQVLKAIPEVPTLLELARNQARHYIRQFYKIEKPYQFHSAVKSLNLPQQIKDVIRFKTPLYL